MDFGFLDYVWRGLVVATLSSTFILLLMTAMSKILSRKWSQLQEKWYLNSQFAVLGLALASEFAVIAFADPELASGCFARFARQGDGFTVTRVVAGVWIAILGVLLAKDAFSMILSIRRAKNFVPANSSVLSKILRETAERIGVREPVQLFVDDQATSPYVFGLFRHQIVIPASFALPLNEAKLKTVLAHELVHVRDRDSLWISLQLVCRRILFFHPLMFTLSREYEITVERAADEQAVQKGGISAGALSRALMDLVTAPSPALPLTVGASRGFKDLKSRLESLSKTSRRTTAPGLSFLALVLASAAASIGISVAQAGEHAGGSRLGEENMCTQVRHEKIIESLLMIKRETNKCEM